MVSINLKTGDVEFGYNEKKAQKTRLCRFFSSPRGCRDGDKCPFAHGREQLEIFSDRECKFGLDCNKDGCPFIHPKKACKDWEAFGTCNKGESCTFVHDERKSCGLVKDAPCKDLPVKKTMKEVGVQTASETEPDTPEPKDIPSYATIAATEAEKPAAKKSWNEIVDNIFKDVVEIPPTAKKSWNEIVDTIFKDVEMPKSISWADEMDMIEAEKEQMSSEEDKGDTNDFEIVAEPVEKETKEKEEENKPSGLLSMPYLDSDDIKIKKLKVLGQIMIELRILNENLRRY